MKELNKETLLDGIDKSKRRTIEALLADTDVHYVVLLESSDKKRRNLLTVGPKLDYANLQAIEGIEIEGLHPVGYVQTTKNTKTSIFRSRASEKVEQLENLVAELRLEKKRLHKEVDQALKTVEKAAEERIFLKEKKDRLARQHEEQSNLQDQIDQREADLLKMEEDLMDRMNLLIQKEAELEQWEEDMFARERRLATNMQKELEAKESKTLTSSIATKTATK